MLPSGTNTETVADGTQYGLICIFSIVSLACNIAQFNTKTQFTCMASDNERVALVQ